MGIFIIFEGGEGSGKSTQARILYQRLLKEGHPSILLHEPGGTSLGDQIRRLLKSQQGGAAERSSQGQRRAAISPLAELLLFATARVQLVDDVLRPALEEGRIVVCDRFTASTVAYQGYGRGVSFETIKHLNRLTTAGVEPDMVVLLDIDPKDGLRRVSAQTPLNLDSDAEPANRRMDEEGYRRFEEEPLSFHRKVHSGYRGMAKAEPKRWVVVDAKLPVNEVAEAIWQQVEPLVRSRTK